MGTFKKSPVKKLKVSHDSLTPRVDCSTCRGLGRGLGWLMRPVWASYGLLESLLI